MKGFKKLKEHIEDELKDAEKYIRDAIMCKEEDPQTAELYYSLSVEEMNHMDRLHVRVVNMIKKYQAEHGSPPADMQAKYDVLHEIYTDKATSIKQLQMIYKA